MLCNNTNELFHVCTPCEVFDARETSFLLAVDLLFFGVLGEARSVPAFSLFQLDPFWTCVITHLFS